MRTTVRKCFWAWDFDREAEWLNEMAAKGLALVAVGFCRYEFEPSEPGEYHIALELLEHSPEHLESRNYMEFLESAHVESVGHYWRWAYYRKKTEYGPLELYSDTVSKIRHLIRILWVVALVAGANFYACVYNPLSLLSLINAVLCGASCWGMWKLWRKIKKLKDDMQLYE